MQMRLHYSQEQLEELQIVQHTRGANVMSVLYDVLEDETIYPELYKLASEIEDQFQMFFIADLNDIICNNVEFSYNNEELCAEIPVKEEGIAEFSRLQNGTATTEDQPEHVDFGAIYDLLEDAKKDNVNQPQHYEQYNLETIRAIQGQSTQEEYQGFLKGNVMKYLSRYQFKNGLEDLYKAQYYLNKLIVEINDDEVEE